MKGQKGRRSIHGEKRGKGEPAAPGKGLENPKTEALIVPRGVFEADQRCQSLKLKV